MVVDELILPEDKPTVMRALLLRHRHVNEHDRFRFGTKRSFASYTSLQCCVVVFCAARQSLWEDELTSEESHFHAGFTLRAHVIANSSTPLLFT
uniref:Uncharacterized protein n=1 Tax=Timema douglasi TaxID=61478 RepID=A0A7R8VYU5_TIMDO|nr:unnamed protein product [Timema douglasi]